MPKKYRLVKGNELYINFKFGAKLFQFILYIYYEVIQVVQQLTSRE